MPPLRPAALAAAALLLVLPAGARAAATLHTETLPSGVSTAADVGDPRTAVMDGSGNLLVALYTSNKGRWAVRPAGGPLGAAQSFPQPSIIGDWPSAATIALDGAGDALAYAGAFWTYRAAGVTTVWGPLTTATGSDRLIDVAMAPTGEAFGVFTNGSTLKVAFRPAGADAQFDLAGATVFNPSPGDTGTTPVGLTIDADGGADLLYRSEHTGSRIYLESRRPAGGAFQTPVQYDWPQAASFRFSRAPDGTAAISGWTGYTTAFAAVRPPGGTFAARQTIETAPVGGELGLYQPVIALNGGRALTAVTHSETYNMCSGGAGGTSGWTIHRYDPAPTGWTTPASGPDTWPQISSVVGMAAAGATAAFVTQEASGTGDRCDGTYQRALTLHVGTADTQQTFTIGSSDGDAARVPDLTFVAAGTGGAVAAGVTSNGGATPDPLERLAVYEDPSAAPSGGGGAGGGGTGGAGGGAPDTGSPAPTPTPGGTVLPGTTPTTTRPTAPPTVTLTGPIGIRENVAPIPFSCPASEPGTCLLAITLFGVKPKASASAATKARTITLGRASAAVKPGKRKTIGVKLSRAGRAFVKPHRTVRATLRVVVTIAGRKTTITKSVKLKRP